MIYACDEGVLGEIVDLLAKHSFLQLVLGLEFDTGWGRHDFSTCSLCD